MGELGNELAKRDLLTKVMAKESKFEGVEAFGFKLNVYEMKKYYEVHFVFTDEDNIEARIDKAINYLGDEGFFKKRKRIKATAIKFNDKEGNY